MISLLLLCLSVEVNGVHLVLPSTRNVTDSEDTLSNCREYAMKILVADWEYNKHTLAELLPEQREYAQESAISFARKQVDNWEAQGYDYCPFFSASGRVVGAEAMNSRISQGHWMFVPEDEYGDWYTEQERKALRGEVDRNYLAFARGESGLPDECLPDGAGRKWPRNVGKESLQLAWSSCAKQAGGCKTMRDVVHWMRAHGMARMLLVGDSMMMQFWEAARCSLYREGCTAVLTASTAKVICPSGSKQKPDKIDLVMVPMSHRQEAVLDTVKSELRIADIAIVNQGHHGLGGVEDVIKLMANKANKDSGTQRKVFWSQSTQPHFPGEDGSFQTRSTPDDVDSNRLDPSFMMCGPLANMSRQFSVNADAETLLRQIDSKNNIHVLPFHQFSAGRWDLHGNWGGTLDPATTVDTDTRRLHWAMDCLHFCYSPTFYAPYFGSLFEALER